MFEIIEYKLTEAIQDFEDRIKWRFFMSEEEKKPFIEAKKINAENKARIALYLANQEVSRLIPDSFDASMSVEDIQKILIRDDVKKELGRVIVNEFTVTQELAGKLNKNFSSENFQRQAEKIINNMIDSDIEGDYENVDIEEDMELSSLNMVDDIQGDWDN